MFRRIHHIWWHDYLWATKNSSSHKFLQYGKYLEIRKKCQPRKGTWKCGHWSAFEGVDQLEVAKLIMELAIQFEFCSFFWVYRVENRVPHVLGKWALKNSFVVCILLSLMLAPFWRRLTCSFLAFVLMEFFL